jgi:putative ABC transport system permease protein
VVRASVLVNLYRARLQRHWLQELLAAAGIATGVALVFAVLVSNSSIGTSAREMVRGVAGRADLQVSARGGEGFPARLVERVRALDAVEAAAPLLTQHAVLRNGTRTATVELVGIDASFAEVGGLGSALALRGLLVLPGIYLADAAGAALGLPAGEAAARDVAVAVRGRVSGTRVNGVLGEREIGSLADGQVAAASLDRVQELSGLAGQATRILVKSLPGREQESRAALERLAGDRLTVGAVDDELRALAVATAPNDQATAMFAAVAAVVGLLLTGTAMLLTVPSRRRELAQLRVHGYGDGQAALVALSQAAALGLVASAAGVAAGYALTRSASLEPPAYLAFAFPIGTTMHFAWWTFAVAIGGGTAVACLAAAQPLLDLRRGRPVNAVYRAGGQAGQRIAPATRRRMALAAVVLIALASALALLWAAATMLAVGLLVVATLLVVPAALALVLKGAEQVERLDRPTVMAIVVGAIRAADVRSLALAATCAVAICGTIAIGGARTTLLDGLSEAYGGYVATADVWVAHEGDDLALQPFGSPARAIRRLPGVAEVREYYGGLLDVGERRAWVIGRPARDRTMVAASQLIDGDAASATARLRLGGWVTVSAAIAREHGARLGEPIALPTPTGVRRYRLAATTTNLGWGPGAIVMNADDYARAWATASPSAIEVDAAPGVSPADVRARVARVLGPASGLQAQTAAERLAGANAVADAGLARLRQIAAMLRLAAAVAIAIAMAAAISERRPQLAAVAMAGWSRLAIWRALMLETALILLAGCLAGVATGTLGHLLLGRWLQETTGYPAPWEWAPGQTLLACATIAVVALASTAIPGYLGSDPPPRMARGKR